MMAPLATASGAPLVGEDRGNGWISPGQALRQALVEFHGERWDFHWTLYVYNWGEGFEACLPAPEKFDDRYFRELKHCWQRIRDAVRESVLPVFDGAGGIRVEPRKALRLRYALAHSGLVFSR